MLPRICRLGFEGIVSSSADAATNLSGFPNDQRVVRLHVIILKTSKGLL